MKPKLPDKTEPLIPKILTDLNLPKVEPIAPVIAEYGDRALLKALPYYFLMYGENIEKLASIVQDKRLKIAFIAIGKIIKYLAKFYKIKE